MLLHVLSIFSAIFGLCSAREFELLPTCKRDSNDYSDCLKRSAQESWPRLIAGISEFDIPSLDPLFHKQEKFVISSDEIGGEIILSNVTVIGLSKNRIINVRTYFLDDIFYLEIDVHTPKLFAKGVVKVNGNLNALRINNEGYFNVTVDDIRGTVNLTGHVINDTWIVEYFHFTPSFGKFKLYYNDFLEENKTFINIIVTFVNEFWPVIFRILLPTLSDKWEPFFINFANKFFSKVPFSKVF